LLDADSMGDLDTFVSFGEWLKQRRKALDLTQAELADRAGCSVFALRKIESGVRRPSKQLAALLAKNLEIPAEEQSKFIKIARGELSVERLTLPPRLTAADQFPRPQSFATLNPTNIPRPAYTLVGREVELATLSRLFSEPQCRLLTITGHGGVGKTRLAIEFATTQRSQFPSGIFYVSLGPLNSPDLIVSAIADVLGFSFSGSVEPKEQLIQYFASRHKQPFLLVLDNIEHLLANTSATASTTAELCVAEILQRLPAARILVTSRERLNIQSEWTFKLQGLPVPPADLERELEEFSAMALFLQSARRSSVNFEPGPSDHLYIRQICRLVDGTPLAIELAAAWVAVLSCQEIAGEIEINLDFLATDMHDVSERHRSLRAAFNHSWALLSAEERQALCKLSIFRGGFRREAAEKVAGATLAQLAALISKSLLYRNDTGRYEFHEVIRQFSEALFYEKTHYSLTCDQHSLYYLTLLQKREKDLKSSLQGEVIRELTEEIDNIRFACSWAIDHGNYLDIQPALSCIGLFFDIRGWLREGIEHFEDLIQALRKYPDDAVYQKILGQTLIQQGLLILRLGNYNLAYSLFEESLAILRPYHDPALLPGPLIFMAVIRFLKGDFEQAFRLVEDGIAHARSVGDLWYEALGVFNQGYFLGQTGQYEAAYEKMHAGIDLWRKLGDHHFTAMGLNFLSYTAIQLGCYEEASGFLQESLQLSLQIGDRWGSGTAYRHLGLVELAQANYHEAKSLIQKSLDLFNELGMRWDIIQSLINLGQTHTGLGDLAQARRIFLDAIPQAIEINAIPLVVEDLFGLACIHETEQNWEAANHLLNFVRNQPSGTEQIKEQAKKMAARLELILKPDQISKPPAQSLPEILDYLALGADPGDRGL
jgi:predicted ATPase/transcriptional regulator with XRE-family HTH domain